MLLNETQKTATMKIDEPPTPFVRYNPDTDTDVSMDELRLSDSGELSDSRTNSQPTSSSSNYSLPRRVQVVPTVGHKEAEDDWDESSDEGALDGEALEKHRQFKLMRNKHYSGEATKARFRVSHLVDVSFSNASSTSSSESSVEDDDDEMSEIDVDKEDQDHNISSSTNGSGKKKSTTISNKHQKIDDASRPSTSVTESVDDEVSDASIQPNTVARTQHPSSLTSSKSFKDTYGMDDA